MLVSMLVIRVVVYTQAIEVELILKVLDIMYVLFQMVVRLECMLTEKKIERLLVIVYTVKQTI